MLDANSRNRAVNQLVSWCI